MPPAAKPSRSRVRWTSVAVSAQSTAGITHTVTRPLSARFVLLALAAVLAAAVVFAVVVAEHRDGRPPGAVSAPAAKAPTDGR